MSKKLVIAVLMSAFVLSSGVGGMAFAQDPYLGSVVKLEDGDTLYYIATDGKRYVYPNEKTYKSWFNDFSNVVTISEEDLANYPLAGNIRYRPGVILVKVQTDPKVYAVSKGGVLRWVKTERLARKLYGENWAMLVDDLAASFFANYSVGSDIDDESDYDADEEVNSTDSVEANRGLALGHLSRILKAKTVRCRAVSAIPADPKNGKKNATPAVSARVCKLNLINDDEGDDGDDEIIDETAPVISSLSFAVATSSATITWTTNEKSNSKVEYATESLDTASITAGAIINELVTSHSIELSGLTPSTTYYFIVKSADAASNVATTTELTFKTAATIQ